MPKLKPIIHGLFMGIPCMIIHLIIDKIALHSSSDDIVERDLKSKGLHVFNDLIPTKDIKKLNDDFASLQSKNHLKNQGQLAGRIYSNGLLTKQLKNHAERIKPYIEKTLNTKKIKIEISYYQESYPQKEKQDIPGGDFHVDDNKANIKYFIYLTDVRKNNGPFSFIPKTGNWRLKGSIVRGILWELTKKRKYLYGYLLNLKKLEKNEKRVMGSAGTHFLVDTTNLHRAQPVKNKYRRVAVISFNRSKIKPLG